VVIIGAIALIVGGLLARHFSIFVLLPTIAIAGVTSLVIAVVRDGAVADGLWLALIIAVALQSGFLAGVVLNGAVAEWRSSRTSQEGGVSRRPR
jgi:hypothetical protein